MSRPLQDPVVHYVAADPRGPDYPRICRNAVVAGEWDDLRDLAVFEPGRIRQPQGIPYDNDPADPAGGTWHFRAWCPADPATQDWLLAKGLTPARSDRSEDPATARPEPHWSWVPARVVLTDDMAVIGRGIGLGLPGAGSAAELVQAAGSATADDPVWLMDGENPVAVIIPAEEYHPPGTCCCKNCPYGGDHGTPEEGHHGTA